MCDVSDRHLRTGVVVLDLAVGIGAPSLVSVEESEPAGIIRIPILIQPDEPQLAEVVEDPVVERLQGFVSPSVLKKTLNSSSTPGRVRISGILPFSFRSQPIAARRVGNTRRRTRWPAWTTRADRPANGVL